MILNSLNELRKGQGVVHIYIYIYIIAFVFNEKDLIWFGSLTKIIVYICASEMKPLAIIKDLPHQRSQNIILWLLSSSTSRSSTTPFSSYKENKKKK